MSRARLYRRYHAHLRYILRCARVGGYVPYRAYARLLDRIWEE